MADEVKVTETTVVADDAERARAAADQAQSSAAAAATMAQVEAANVTQQAADRMAAMEAEASQWRGLKEAQEGLTAEYRGHREKTEASLAGLQQQLSTILSRLEPKPESLTNPPTESSNPGGEKTTAPQAAEPEKPVTRKRAHRWI
ncbi:MAG: hypothetical protein C5B60_01785 [Chloroflexi bacterium]|nr:MAG: hypothetical protein C5B60_01785 [Chloroflexota bacterium]